MQSENVYEMNLEHVFFFYSCNNETYDYLLCVDLFETA